MGAAPQVCDEMIAPPCILAVSSNLLNLELLVRFLEKEGFRTVQAVNLAAFEQALATPSAIQLALIDISGFDHSIWDSCSELHTLSIPLLVILPRDRAALEQESLAHGARGALTKPLVIKELLRLMHSLLDEVV